MIFSFFKKTSDCFGFVFGFWIGSSPRCSALECAAAVLLPLMYCAPRLELHGLQAGTNSVSSPTRSYGIRWSASVAGALLHQWHSGLSCSSSARLRLNSGLDVLLLMVAPCYRAPPRGLGLFRCGRVLCNARPPRFQYVSEVAGCLTSLDGHHSHL